MIDLARENAHLAGAANALFAGAGNKYAGVIQGCKDRAVRRHGQRNAGRLADHFETARRFVVGPASRREPFEADGVLRPRCARRFDREHQPFRAAAINHRVVFGGGEPSRDIEPRAGGRAVQVDLAAQRADFVEERRLVIAAVAIEERPFFARRTRCPHHRQQRRDADAAGDEQIIPRVRQCEIVAWRC